ncbi:MAG: hypothetical protein ABFD50_05310 [Smithella sp.]
MNIMKTFFIQSLLSAFLLTGFNVFAVDQSICDPNANIVLYNNGALQSCQLKDNYDINNITCKQGTIIRFYDNGQLESCVLNAEVTISDTRCKPDSPISFYIDGNLRSCMKLAF